MMKISDWLNNFIWTLHSTNGIQTMYNKLGRIVENRKMILHYTYKLAM